MRATTRKRVGALAAAAAACVLATQPTRASAQICEWPGDVPDLLLSALATCTNCLVTVPPACPPAQIQKCFEFPADPTPELCDKIAAAEVSGCSKAVKDTAACNNAVNSANATAKQAHCQSLPSPVDQDSCSELVQAELSALAESVKTGAATGQQGCLDLQSSVRALCLGDTL